MKPYVRGKSIFFREVSSTDSEFIISLRKDPEKARYISPVSESSEKQSEFISSYLESFTDFYFIICDWSGRPVGTIRIYDVRLDSFCWGSWILSNDAPRNAAIESALMIYDFAFFSLHYSQSHFDVRIENHRVVEFHNRFGATVVGDDGINYFFNFTIEEYFSTRKKYRRYLPGLVR